MGVSSTVKSEEQAVNTGARGDQARKDRNADFSAGEEGLKSRKVGYKGPARGAASPVPDGRGLVGMDLSRGRQGTLRRSRPQSRAYGRAVWVILASVSRESQGKEPGVGQDRASCRHVLAERKRWGVRGARAEHCGGRGPYLNRSRVAARKRTPMPNIDKVQASVQGNGGKRIRVGRVNVEAGIQLFTGGGVSKHRSDQKISRRGCSARVARHGRGVQEDGLRPEPPQQAKVKALHDAGNRAAAARLQPAPRLGHSRTPNAEMLPSSFTAAAEGANSPMTGLIQSASKAWRERGKWRSTRIEPSRGGTRGAAWAQAEHQAMPAASGEEGGPGDRQQKAGSGA